MARFLEPLTQSGFAHGVVNYLDNYPGEENHNRIVLPVNIINDETPSVQAIIDTGAPYCIIDPEILNEYSEYFQVIEETIISIRGINIHGSIIRIPIILAAEQGVSLEIEATVFFPNPTENENWIFPNFLGLSGFLDRIRFALDPEENSFYFSVNNV